MYSGQDEVTFVHLWKYFLFLFFMIQVSICLYSCSLLMFSLSLFFGWQTRHSKSTSRCGPYCHSYISNTVTMHPKARVTFKNYPFVWLSLLFTTQKMLYVSHSQTLYKKNWINTIDNYVLLLFPKIFVDDLICKFHLIFQSFAQEFLFLLNVLLLVTSGNRGGRWTTNVDRCLTGMVLSLR